MVKEKFKLTDKELQFITNLYISVGKDKTYNIIKAKLLLAMIKSDNIDEQTLDISDALLILARDEEDTIIHEMYYDLSIILRKIAHEIYRKYIRGGKARDNNRFLRLVSDKTQPVI